MNLTTDAARAAKALEVVHQASACITWRLHQIESACITWRLHQIESAGITWRR